MSWSIQGSKAHWMREDDYPDRYGQQRWRSVCGLIVRGREEMAGSTHGLDLVSHCRLCERKVRDAKGSDGG